MLDGSGPALQTPPSLSDWPEISWDVGPRTRKVNLDTLKKEDMQDWQPGETILLSSKMLTGRDAAHKKIQLLFPREFRSQITRRQGEVN